MPPDERQSLSAGLAGMCPHPVWVFTASMLHPDEDSLERLYLTTTEREFMRHTEYDEAVQSQPMLRLAHLFITWMPTVRS